MPDEQMQLAIGCASLAAATQKKSPDPCIFEADDLSNEVATLCIQASEFGFAKGILEPKWSSGLRL
jgi:hypothetical protein